MAHELGNQKAHSVLVIDADTERCARIEEALGESFEVVCVCDSDAASAALAGDTLFALTISDVVMLRDDIGIDSEPFCARALMRHLVLVDDASGHDMERLVNQYMINRVVVGTWTSEELAELAGDLCKSFWTLSAADAQLVSDNQGLRLDVRDLDRQLVEQTQRVTELEAEMIKLRDTADGLSTRDPLTGLYNHRAFRERLHEEVARARRYDQPLSLVMGDVDEFSRINTSYGFELGDTTLRRIAELVFASDAPHNRASDVAARYEGQRFVVLLPETGRRGAVVKAERLRETMGKAGFLDEGLTMSFGIASFPSDCDDPEALIRTATQALRVAKDSGKNQVAVYGDSRDDQFRLDDDDRTVPPTRTVLGSGPTMFPSYHQRVGEIIATLERDRSVACLYVDLSRLRFVEQEYGLARHAAVFNRAGTLLHSLQGSRLRREDLICRTEVDDGYVCVLSPARQAGGAASDDDLDAIARRVEEVLQEELAAELRELGATRPRITVGYSRVLLNPLIRAERLIARLIEEARESATMARQRSIRRDKAHLQEMILGQQLTPVYQPIVHLESCGIFGFESLTRGPAGTRLESPLELFGIADEVDLTFELDRACFRNALRAAHELEPIHRLFVNVLPLSFYDQSFIEEEVRRLLEEADLRPANLVFEITEKLAIENFSSFRRALQRYTAMGFGVAIDDVGTRHSNLETVMALRPHFIKVSDVLTLGIARSTVKREMLRSLGRIAEAIDAVVVAEGIEDPEDLAVLCDLGVRYGQGFILARPGPPFPRLSDDVKQTVRALRSESGAPIPAPSVEYDEDGDFREGAMPATIRDAVLQRAAGQMNSPSEVFAVLKARALPGPKKPMAEDSSPQWPKGTLPATKLEKAITSQSTQRLDVTALRLGEPELAALRDDSDTPAGSLLDGLRRRRRDTSGETADGVPDAEVEDSTNPFDQADSTTNTRELNKDPESS